MPERVKGRYSVLPTAYSRLPLVVTGICLALSAAGCDPRQPGAQNDGAPDAAIVDGAIDASGPAVIDQLAPIASDATALALDGDHAYWLQSGAIYRIHKQSVGGASPELVIAPGSYPNALAVADGHVYWSTNDHRSINRARTDGGPEEVVVSWSVPGEPARELALDDTHVYWREEAQLARVGKSGGDREALTPVASVIGAVTLASEHVYFTYPDTGSDVWRVSKSGGQVEVAFNITVLTADSMLGKTRDRILQCGKDSLDPYRSLIAGYSTTAPMGDTGEVLAIIPDTATAIAGDNKYAYCAADTGIHRVPRNGGQVEMLATGQDIVSAAADSDGLFWLDVGALALYRRVER